MRRSTALLVLLALTAVAAVLPIGLAEAHRGLSGAPPTVAVPAPPVAEAERATLAASVALEDPIDLPAALTGAAGQLRPAPSPGVVPWWLVLTSLLALAAACPLGRRRSVAVGLVLLLAVLAAETGVHSVHHLGNAVASQSCPVAATAQHLSGVDAEPPMLCGLELAASGETLPTAAAPASTRALAPDAGRAPPALSA